MIDYIIYLDGSKYSFKYKWAIELYNKFLKDNNLEVLTHYDKINMIKWAEIYKPEFIKFRSNKNHPEYYL
jgi:hypothetical protein